MKKIVLIAALIGAGYYVYAEYFSVSDEALRVKKLFDKVSSTPVSAEDLKPVFEDAMIIMCQTNGVDTINGFGTVDECISNFETLVSEYCFEQISNFEHKEYLSKVALREDFSVFMGCSIDLVVAAAKINASE